MARIEWFDRVLSFGTPLVLVVKSLLESMVKNPDIQKAATDKFIEIAKGGRTRSDELFFFASLIDLKGVKEENKLLFLEKHRQMLDPVFTGKSSNKIKKLREMRDRAKGLVFLMAEDETANEKKPSDKFAFANKVWYGIFLGIEKCANDAAKLSLLEERIIHFGKNSQHGMTLVELRERAGEIFPNALTQKIGTCTKDASTKIAIAQTANMDDLTTRVKSFREKAKEYRQSKGR